MIQDRLTAKFQSAKPVKKREARTETSAVSKPKTVKEPAMSIYTNGRKLAGSFWL